MRVLVTGAAGFIGSTLVDRLLADDHEVVGVDCFGDFYDPAIKRNNLVAARDHERFELAECDLRGCELAGLLDGVDVVHHVAGQPGVRASWGPAFADFVEANVLVTQRLLDACRAVPLRRFVFSSSSSVYGEAAHVPSGEATLPAPRSPYGVTKLAAEHLARLYATSFGVPTVSLRYFTVFGPRQRPDMAVARLIDAAVSGRSFPLNGDGSQARALTFVDDVVAANVSAGEASPDQVVPGSVMNIGGGEVTSLATIIEVVEQIAGRPIRVDRLPPAVGEVDRTDADTRAARALLGWVPEVSVRAGVERQVKAHTEWLDCAP